MVNIGWFLGMVLMAGAPTIYEWVDEDGNRQFSDRKPVGEQFIEREVDESSLTTYERPEIEPIARGKRSTESDSNSKSTRDSERRATIASERAEQQRVCESLLQQIDTVQDQLRRGYSEPRGQRLRNKRRALRSEYYEKC